MEDWGNTQQAASGKVDSQRHSLLILGKAKFLKDPFLYFKHILCKQGLRIYKAVMLVEAVPQTP